MARNVNAVGMVALMLMALGVGASATTLSVDIGASGQQVEDGFEAFTDTGSGTKSVIYTSALGTAGTVTVELGGTGGWRNRSSGVQHAIGDVLEDITFFTGTKPVTLKDLKAGTYYFRSYHHDTGFSQGSIDVSLTDATRSNRLMVDDLAQSNGGTVPKTATTVPLIIQANGSSDVVVSLTNNGNVSLLNGLEITDSAPAGLNVDIGGKNAGNDVQAGFQSFAMVNSGGSGTGGYQASPQEHWFFTEAGNAGSVRVNLSNPSNSASGLGFRDRGDVTHQLGDLAEDFVFNNTGTRLDLELGSLKPGGYEVTTYSHDPTHGVSGTLDLRVSDALGNQRLVATSVSQTSGTSPTTIASATFSVFSNGVDPVVVHMDENVASHAALNGFTTTPDDALRVDFAHSTADSATGHDVQNGFLAFARNASNTTGTQSATFSNALGIGGSVTVKVSAADNVLSWRDRGDSLAAELGDVAEDFVFDQRSVELVLENLEADWYLMTTYHHDRIHIPSDLDIYISDALGTDRLVASGLTQTVAGSGDPAFASFTLIADGINPVTIRFDNMAADPAIARLNGFSLTPAIIPEPTTLSLLAIGALGLVARRRKKQ